MTTDQLDVARRIVETALKDYMYAGKFGVAIFGSVAEGLGNSLSDIDILLVYEDPNADKVPMREMTFIDDRRCEIFVKTIDELEGLASRVNSWADAIPMKGLPEFLWAIDTSQRIANCIPVEGADIINRAKGLFSKEHIARVVCNYEREEMRDCFNKAFACSVLGLHEQSRVLATEALVHAMGLYCSKRGDTYRSPKFIMAKLQRLGFDHGRINEIRQILARSTMPHQSMEFMEEIMEAAKTFGEVLVPAPFDLVAATDLKFFTIGSSCFLASSSNVFLVSRTHEERARDLSMGRAVRSTNVDADKEFAEFLGIALASGLIGARWSDDSGSRTYFRYVDSLEACSSFHVTFSDVSVDVEHQSMLLVKLDTTADTLIQAGINLGQDAMLYSNRREDALGALRERRWDEVEHALREMTYAVCHIAIGSTGKYKRPTPEWLLVTLAALPDRVKFREHAARILEMSVCDSTSALRMYEEVEAFLCRLPKDITGELLHAFESGLALWKTVQTLVAWGDGAITMGLPVLADEGNGAEAIRAFKESPVSRFMKPDAMAKLAGWQRTDDIASELRKLIAADGVV